LFKINRLIIIVIILFPSISYGLDPWDKWIEDFVSDTTQDIKSYFPNVEGYIVHIIDKDVYTNLGIDTKVKRGMVLTVLKEGDESHHPATDNPVTDNIIVGMADKDKEIGHLQILKVRRRYSIARVIDSDNIDDIKVGRKVYITPEKVGVVIMNISMSEGLDFPAQSFIEGFTNALKDSGRFSIVSIVERSDIELFKGDHIIIDPKSLQDPVNAEIARKGLGADIIIFPYIKII
jgi:hypothetical protein